MQDATEEREAAVKDKGGCWRRLQDWAGRASDHRSDKVSVGALEHKHCAFKKSHIRQKASPALTMLCHRLRAAWEEHSHHSKSRVDATKCAPPS